MSVYDLHLLLLNQPTVEALNRIQCCEVALRRKLSLASTAQDSCCNITGHCTQASLPQSYRPHPHHPLQPNTRPSKKEGPQRRFKISSTLSGLRVFNVSKQDVLCSHAEGKACRACRASNVDAD